MNITSIVAPAVYVQEVLYCISERISDIGAEPNQPASKHTVRYKNHGLASHSLPSCVRGYTCLVRFNNNEDVSCMQGLMLTDNILTLTA